MKFLLLFCLTIVLGVSPARAGVAPDLWLTDFTKAQAETRVSGKFMFVHFSGTDWCGWCMKLRKDVFLKPQFEEYARSNLVLLRVDFPKRTPQSAALQKTNERLAAQFGVQGYPTLLILNGSGEKLGSVSYGHGGARQLVSDIEKVIRPPVDQVPAKAPLRKGAELHRAQKASSAESVKRTDLALKKITGSKRRRQAVINNQTFSPGQTVTIKVASGQIRVRCVEIRERSVVVAVDGERERRELTLPGT